MPNYNRIDYWGFPEDKVFDIIVYGGLLNRKCQHCGFVTRNTLQNECPRCGDTSPSISYPYGTIPAFLKTIARLTRWRKEEETRSKYETITRLNRECGVIVDERVFLDNIEELMSIWRENETDSNVTDIKMKEYIRAKFGVSDDISAGRIYGIMLNYKYNHDEDGPLVVIVNTFIEAQFDLFLRDGAIYKQQYDDFVRDIRNKGWGWRKRKGWFLKLTRANLETYIRNSDWTRFVTESKAMNECRDKYVHGYPLGVARSHVITALRLVGVSLDFFREANNEFWVKIIKGG